MIFEGGSNYVLIPGFFGQHMAHNSSDVWLPEPSLSCLLSSQHTSVGFPSFGKCDPRTESDMEAWLPNRTHHLCPGVCTSIEVVLGYFSFLSGTSLSLPTPPVPPVKVLHWLVPICFSGLMYCKLSTAPSWMFPEHPVFITPAHL